MSVVLVPLAGLTLTPLTIWVITALADRHHTRRHDDARELQAIDQWLHAIQAAR